VLRRQDAPRVLEHVASIYVLRPAYLRSAHGLMDGRARGFEMPPERSLDIDSELDFQLIECLMKDRMTAEPR
jgi:N-acylneuraminate cytidylyltransferase